MNNRLFFDMYRFFCDQFVELAQYVVVIWRDSEDDFRAQSNPCNQYVTISTTVTEKKLLTKYNSVDTLNQIDHSEDMYDISAILRFQHKSQCKNIK